MIALFSRPLPRLVAVVGLQLLILLSIIAFKQYTIWTGDTVLLRTQPVDPRELLRGDYATVRYDISTINAFERGSDGGSFYGTVYVELRKGDNGYWHAVAIHDKRERDFDGTVLIKGRVSSTRFGPEVTSFDYDTYEVDYGIEDIFIPEGSGDQIPSSTRETTVGVEVKDRFGNAVPRRLLVDGEPLDLERR